MLNAQFVAHMIAADMTPMVYMGLHLIGARTYDGVVSAIAAKRGY